jgi:hypothetical protein
MPLYVHNVLLSEITDKYAVWKISKPYDELFLLELWAEKYTLIGDQ